jgi:hypothetical protein
MKTPSLKQKVEQYEAFLHAINSFLICGCNTGIQELVQNADQWSYSFRVGNGELSDREQQKIINTAFWELLNTPKADKETQERQKAFSALTKQTEEAFLNLKNKL